LAFDLIGELSARFSAIVTMGAKRPDNRRLQLAGIDQKAQTRSTMRLSSMVR
jgi:hypothetical protein